MHDLAGINLWIFPLGRIDRVDPKGDPRLSFFGRAKKYISHLGDGFGANDPTVPLDKRNLEGDGDSHQSVTHRIHHAISIVSRWQVHGAP